MSLQLISGANLFKPKPTVPAMVMPIPNTKGPTVLVRMPLLMNAVTNESDAILNLSFVCGNIDKIEKQI